MDFGRPTSTSEMFEILKEIYKFYRIKKEDYEVIELPKINLQKISYTPLTNEQISLKAEEFLKGKQQREILEKKEEILKQIALIQEKINVARAKKIEDEEKIVESYDLMVNELEKEGYKNGIIKGSIIAENKLELFRERDEKIRELEELSVAEISALQGEKVSLENKFDQVENYYSSLHLAEIDSKVKELKEKEDEFLIDVLKYNNAVDEKNIKYSNYVDNIYANLRLKYIEIKTNPRSKDELVYLGYYKDVINCVTAYYNTLDPSIAYERIRGDTDLMMFLEDFYEIVLDYYKRNANEA